MISVSLRGEPWQKSTGPRSSTGSETTGSKAARKSRCERSICAAHQAVKRRKPASASPGGGTAGEGAPPIPGGDAGVERLDALAVAVAHHEARAVAERAEPVDRLGHE